MRSEKVQKKASTKDGSNEPDSELENALTAFINQADKSQKHEASLKEKIRHHLKDVTGVLEVAGLIVAIGIGAVNVALWCAQLNANSINQKGLVESNRAFIYFENTQFLGDPQDNSKFLIIVPMGNSGNTPTVGLTYEMGCYATYQSGFVRYYPSKDKVRPSHASIGPKVVVTPVACTLTINKAGKVSDSDGDTSDVFTVIGQANYYDALQPKAPHVTEFCYWVQHFQSSGGTSDLNALTQPCSNRNCADSECKSASWPFPS